jgi:hypothetical protein
MREADGTLADLTLALNEAIVELSAPVAQADGTLASATSQLNALLVWADSAVAPADGTLASATSQYNLFVGENRMAEYSLQALHDEIEADPVTLGYKEGSGAWKGDQVIADLINAKNYVIDQTSIDMEAVRASTTYEGYDTLAIDEQEWLRWMTPGSGQFVVTADMKLQLTGRTLTTSGVAGTGTDAQSFWAAAHRGALAPAMLALIEIGGSRAEVLWGAGVTISSLQVARAANL